MDRQQAKKLVERYNRGLATAEERALLENWYAKKSDELLLQDGEIDFNAIEAELRNRTFEYAGVSYKTESVQLRSKLWPRIAAAAAILLVVGAGLFFYTSYYAPRHLDDRRDPLSANDISPGKIGATLTLANGKKITLSDAKNGELAKESGVTITKDANGQLVYVISSERGDESALSAVGLTNTLTTAKGETYQVRLPDGTLIWLNAASTLKYPASFAAHKNRRVELSGEGYFDVAKDKAHPFIVATDKQEVEVLGTHFNINSYVDEPSTKTTLLEGSVRVSLGGRHPEFISGSRTSKAIRDEVILKPNQQSVLTANNQIKVTTVDPETAIAWKEGFFKFKEDKLEDILHRVSRWYDVEIIYVNESLKNKAYSGTVSRFANVSQVLKKLELTGSVHFKIEGRTIEVSK